MTKQRKPKVLVSPLLKALIAGGATFCTGCKTYIDSSIHRCSGTPSVSQVWNWEWTKRPEVTPHHDPIDPEWKELEAEETNAHD